ncbi:MAG: putative bifunctional diguanylate cyclase/phosphodiesterase [Spirochaetia bacterium]
MESGTVFEPYAHIFELSRDAITLIDRNYRYVLANAMYCREVGRTREEVIGAGVADIWGEDTFRDIIKPRIDESFEGRQSEYLETFEMGGRQRHMRVTFHPYREDTKQVTHVLVFTRDITPEDGEESKIPESSHYDRLTGLFNRNTMEVTLSQQLNQARRANPPQLRVLMFVSFRNFKVINRIHGHGIGDILLENSAIRVTECLRSSDLVFRFDGANFVVLLTEIQRPTDASLVAAKIHEAVGVPYRLRNLDLRVECFIGIGLYPHDAHDAGGLIQAANSASVEAEERREPYLFYDGELHQQAISRSRLHTQLQRAFEAREFRLYYQPIVDVSGQTPRIVGAEALLRWEHPDRGTLSPGSFLPLAEETKVILAIDKWALFTVCEALRSLNSRADVILSVNISSASFVDPQFFTVLEGALEAAGNPDPKRLRLELTESMSVEHVESLSPLVKRIEELGIQLWVDDFGVGQSSLSLLKMLPAHGIKIDRSFVDGIDESPRERRYLESIMESVRARDKEVILEGVSTGEQLEIVQSLRCRLVQGYYLGGPMPFSELETKLQQ